METTHLNPLSYKGLKTEKLFKKYKTFDDYVKYFGDSVKLYEGSTETFHTADCVYGVYE